jgi:hypothetical protein
MPPKTRPLHRKGLSPLVTCSDDLYDDRREWLENGLEELANCFAVAVGGFSMMENHLHVLMSSIPKSLKPGRMRMSFGAGDGSFRLGTCPDSPRLSRGKRRLFANGGRPGRVFLTLSDRRPSPAGVPPAGDQDPLNQARRG